MTNNARNIRQANIKVKKTSTKVQSKTIHEKKIFAEKPLFLILIILAITCIAFIPSLKNDFITSWDDDLFVTDNVMIRQLDLPSVKSIFTTPVAGAYVPLPVLTFALEYHFFGLNPVPYHISNLILHLICTLLIFQLLRLLWLNSIYAAFGALLFGIHPMHVESVAWVTERKDLLYGLFYLASMIVYLKYIHSPGSGFKFFILALLFFILALFSKIQAVTLPVCLLLIDYYTQRPVRLKLIFEKIPFFALSLVFGIAGILVLKEQRILQSNEIAGLSGRIFSGLYALSNYFIKFFAPFHLSAVYPFPEKPVHSLPLLYYLSLIFLLVMGYFSYRTLRHTRAVVFAVLFFLFNMIFMLQILAAGSTFLSDRYTYISYAGFCFIAGWSMERIAKNKKEMKHIFTTTMALVIILFASLTFNRCKIWKNGETLWTDAIEKYPDEIARPYFNRGATFKNSGQWDKATADFSKAISIDPGNHLAFTGLGIVYGNLGQWDKALANLSRAIEINPDYADAYYNRGIIYWNLRDGNKAVADYSRAIAINPNYSNAYFNRGIIFRNLKEWDKAIADYTRVLEFDPKDIKAYGNRGIVYENLGQWDKAIDDYTRVTEIDPKDIKAYVKRGDAYSSIGQWDKAIPDYSRALEIDPGFTIAQTNRETAYRNLKKQK